MRIQANILIILLMGVSATLYSQADRKFIRQGNKEYNEELFDESEILYRKALENNHESFTGEFNLGDALYKQEKYEDAVRSFKKLSENEKEPGQLGNLYHNLGNSLLKANQLEESIEAYKNALRNNPVDEETRHNLAYAQNMLQQQQQQDKDKDQDQDQQDQNQDQQDQNQDQQDQNKDQQDQNQDQQDQQQQQISREDAQQMLQALQEDEQDLQEKLQKQKAVAQRVKVLKDW